MSKSRELDFYVKVGRRRSEIGTKVERTIGTVQKSSISYLTKNKSKSKSQVFVNQNCLH